MFGRFTVFPQFCTFFAVSVHETFTHCMFSISYTLVETSVEYRVEPEQSPPHPDFITWSGIICQLMCVPHIQRTQGFFLSHFKHNARPNIKENPLIAAVSFRNVCTLLQCFKEHCMETERNLELLVNQSFHWACEGMHWHHTLPAS